MPARKPIPPPEPTAVKIDNGVAVVPRIVGRGYPGPHKTKWPWRSMKVGDSFFASGYTISRNYEGLPRFSALGGRQVVPGSAWITRTVTEKGIRGVRVWRVK